MINLKVNDVVWVKLPGFRQQPVFWPAKVKKI